MRINPRLFAARNNSFAKATLAALAALAGSAEIASAQYCSASTVRSLLTANDAAALDSMGACIAASGDWAAMGVPNDDTVAGADAGSVILFRRTDGVWNRISKIFANDGAAGDKFGTSVAMSGSTLIVGAPSDDNARGTNAGAVYVYAVSTNGATHEAKLLAADGAANDEFGISVALGSVGVIQGRLQGFIGAHKANAPASDSGAVYTMQRSVEVGGIFWDPVLKLTASDAAAGDNFGFSLAHQSGRLFIGAPLDDNAGGTDAGAVYPFRYNSGAGARWLPGTKITSIAAPTMTMARFGHALAHENDLLVIGMPLFTYPSGDRAGIAEVWRSTGTLWQLEVLLSGGERPANIVIGSGLGLGASVAVLGGVVAAGSPAGASRIGQEWAGYVNVYKKDDGEWRQRRALTHGSNDVSFGASVAITGNTFLVGAPRSSLSAANAGYGYAIEVNLTSAPSITQQPMDQTTCPRGLVRFTVASDAAAGEVQYQWQRESTTTPGTFFSLLDGPTSFGTLSGTTTPTFVIDSVGTTPRRFRCIITNSCGSVNSQTATYLVCFADLDDGSGTGMCDGGVTVSDLLYFIEQFDAGATRADLDNGGGLGTPDGGVTIDDLLFFLARFEGGC